ncbi:MAG: glycosyltransferase family 4 protein [Planctomycetota bacterium]|jgi:glycosyltransferase involved in cell wall biosynthesis
MEKQAHKLAKKLKEKGIKVEIVTGWWFRGTPRRELIDSIPVYRNQTMWQMFDIKGLRKFGGYLYIVSLLWFLWRRRADFDILHVHGLNYHTFTAVLAGRWLQRKTLTKVANSGRASDINKMRNGQQLPLTRYLLSTALRCDRFVATNRTIARELLSAGVPRRNILALPNGVETELIRPKSNYNLSNPITVAFVGRFHEQKGVDILLRAFQRLLKRHSTSDIRLQLLGDGPLREPLVELAQQLGIINRVEFLGHTHQVIQQLQQADIFILPSRAEGLSNALLEAMASGLPVVVSRIPGNIDTIQHKKNGLLFEVDNPDSLAESLVSLLSNLKFREALGKAARRSVEEKYSLSYVADRYINLYRDLLSSSSCTASHNPAGQVYLKPVATQKPVDEQYWQKEK